MDSAKLIAELVQDECRNGKPELRVYYDTKGVPTIGVGRNLKVGITNEEAYYLLNNDLDSVEGELDHAVSWWRKLDGTRQRVIANMCFNMGLARLLGFHKFLAHAERGEWEDASREMLDSKWAKEDVQPARSERLAEMMRKGDSYVAVVA